MERFSMEVSEVEVNPTPSNDFLKLKLYAISDGVNRNESEFTFESFEEGIKTIPNKPILAYYNTKLGDVEEHNSQLAVDRYGEVFEDFQYTEAEKPVGVTPESSNIYIEEKDGKHWIVIENALIWTNYNYQLTDLLLKQKEKKVSVEVEVLERETVDGIDRFYKWNWLGITILGRFPDGTKVEEGIEGAHLELLEFGQSDRFKTFTQKMSTEYNKSIGKSDVLSTYGLKEKATMALTMNELRGKIDGRLSQEKYDLDGYSYYRYWLHDIVFDDNMLILEDNVSHSLVAMPYKEINGELEIMVAEAKPVTLTYKYTLKNEKIEVFLSKKEWGTGETIKVDKSTEAVSDSSWGDVNKTELRNKVLKAKNYKSLVKSVYLKVEDGWEDAPASHLKYPVMEIKGNKAIYNSNGLLSAQQYGEKYDESVARKAKRIRIKLGLTEKERSEKMTKFIELAKNEGYVYLGTNANKMYFVKAEEACDTKECGAVDLYSVECDKAKCADDEPDKEFSADVFDCRPMKFDDDEDDDKDDKDDDDSDDKDDKSDDDDKDDKEKESLKAELEKCKAELAAKCDELHTIRMEEMKKETDALMEKEACDEEMKKELCSMRDNGKFANVEEFTKELAYRKFIKASTEKKENTDSKSMTFGLNNNVNVDTKPKSIFDEL